MRKYSLITAKQGKKTVAALYPIGADEDPAAVYIASEVDQIINLARELALLVHDGDVPEYRSVAHNLMLHLPSNTGGQ